MKQFLKKFFCGETRGNVNPHLIFPRTEELLRARGLEPPFVLVDVMKILEEHLSPEASPEGSPEASPEASDEDLSCPKAEKFLEEAGFIPPFSLEKELFQKLEGILSEDPPQDLDEKLPRLPKGARVIRTLTPEEACLLRFISFSKGGDNSFFEELYLQHISYLSKKGGPYYGLFSGGIIAEIAWDDLSHTEQLMLSLER